MVFKDCEVLHAALAASGSLSMSPSTTESHPSIQNGPRICRRRVRSWAQSVGQSLKDALAASSSPSVVVELDWKESVLHDSERCSTRLSHSNCKHK